MKVVLWFCKPVKMSLRALKSEQMNEELSKVKPKDLKLNYNFKRSRLRVLMRQAPLEIKTDP